MAISSINFAKSSGGSFAHNDRSEKEPNYLLPIEHRLENECNRSAVEAQKMLENLFENAKENYSKTYGQKFQTKFENAHWEAVINLNKEHSIKDVERLVREIEKETGFTAVQISIHRDEGRLNEKTGHPIYNLHAHVNFSTLDPETGRQLYRRSISNSEREKIRKENGIPDGEKIPKHLTAVMDKAKLSKLQDITAEALGMERGERGSEKVRLGHKQYRATEQEKEKLLEKIEELQKENTELRYSFRDMQKQITALEGIDAEQKKELHRLNTEINKTKDQDEKDEKIKELIEQIITKEQTIDQLKSDLENTPKISQPIHEPIHEPIHGSKFAKLQEENEILQITNKVLERELKEAKEAPTPKGENEASKEIEEAYSKLPNGTFEDTAPTAAEIESQRAAMKELVIRQEKDDFAEKLIAEHTKLGITNKQELAKSFTRELKANHELHKKSFKMLPLLNEMKTKAIEAFKDVAKNSKSALESVFNKITGKSIPEVKKEREEHLNAQKERERLERQKEDRGKGNER
ncbi:hypothetical protein [Sulfuricurvum sp.]|uniref:hypothetical protein n=1 Tax=Sulfuricurvum sp. TaxID=2025608 RepID=UPI00261A2F8D|nr:hypothetical protein [Sulfuricurvum sp.]MDD2782291.1 hypothetical protein [Sulfuricurvum sp.]